MFSLLLHPHWLKPPCSRLFNKCWRLFFCKQSKWCIKLTNYIPLLSVSITHAPIPPLLCMSSLQIPFIPVFRYSPDFVGFKELCPGVLKNSVRDSKCPGFSKWQKYDISDNVYEHSDFPIVVENTYRSKRDINQKLTARNRRRGGGNV